MPDTRVISKTYVSSSWPPPCVMNIADGEVIKLENATENIIPVYKNDHLCQVYSTRTVHCKDTTSSSTPTNQVVKPSRPFSSLINVDPGSQLSAADRDLFIELHLKYDELFEPVIGLYNDYDGKVRARVNLGRTIPPTRKLHVPRYDKKNLDLLQDKFDELERQGVFRRDPKILALL